MLSRTIRALALLAAIAACGGAWAQAAYYDGAGYPRRRCADGYECAVRPYPRPRSVLIVPVPAQPAVTYGKQGPEFAYWCDDPKRYYPAVHQCSGPWRERSAEARK